MFPMWKHGVLDQGQLFNASLKLSDLIKVMWLVHQNIGILTEQYYSCWNYLLNSILIWVFCLYSNFLWELLQWELSQKKSLPGNNSEMANNMYDTSGDVLYLNSRLFKAIYLASDQIKSLFYLKKLWLCILILFLQVTLTSTDPWMTETKRGERDWVCRPSYPQTCCVEDDDLELLIHLPSFSQCRNHSCAPQCHLQNIGAEK